MKITISGWYGHFNAGDDAILQVFLEQAIARFNCNVVVLSELPRNIERSRNVDSMYHLPVSTKSVMRSVVNGDLFRHLKNLRSTDLFVLGGGGLLRDNTTWSNLFRLLDEIWLCKLFGKKVMLYAIGVGPFKSRLGKYLIGKTVKMCDLITVRDAKSAELLKEIGVPPSRIHIVADPAFLLLPKCPRDQDLISMLSGKKKVGVFPTWHSAYESGDLSQAKRLATTLDDLAEKASLRFIGLPMQVRDFGMDDVQFTHAIKAAMKYPEALEIYEKRLSASELKWVTGQTLFNITVRLHAMIFSLGADAPVVATNYEPKVKNVFSALDCPEYLIELDAQYEQKHSFAAVQCLNNLEDYSRKIASARPNYEHAAQRTFLLMESLFPTRGQP